jgi:hypothetical protein
VARECIQEQPASDQTDELDPRRVISGLGAESLRPPRQQALQGAVRPLLRKIRRGQGEQCPRDVGFGLGDGRQDEVSH